MKNILDFKKSQQQISHIIYNKGFIRYFENTSWILLEKVTKMLIGISIGVWVIRYLGPKDFGDLSYAESFVDLFSVIALVGTDLVGADKVFIREFIRDKKENNALIGTSFILRLVGSSLAFVMIIISTNLVGNTEEQCLFIYIISLSLFAKSFTVLGSYFHSRVLSGYVVCSNMIALFLCSCLRIFFIIQEFPAIYFALTILFDFVISSIFYVYFYYKKREVFLRWSFDLTLARSLFRYSWPYLFNGVTIIIYSRIGQVMLTFMLGSHAVGYYTAATKISEPAYLLPCLVAKSLLPAIINAKAKSNKEYIFRLQRTYDLVFFLFLGICLPVTFFSEEITQLLYGSQFSISGSILQIHILSGFLIVAGAVRGNWILSENLQKYEFLIHLTEAIANILLNFIFIKSYGVIGAAYGTLSACVFTFLFTGLVIKKIRPSFFMTLKSFTNIMTFQFLRKKYFQL